MKNKAKEKKIEGIGGWLLFFVVMATLSVIIQIPIILSGYTYDIGGLTSLIIAVSQTVFIGVALYFIFKRKKKAINWTIFMLGYSIISGFFAVVLVLPEGMLSWIIGPAYNTAFIFYFLRSKRVKNTFVKK